MTLSGRIWVTRFRISSEMPSEKYSCSASALTLSNGSTAIDISSGPRGHHLSPANISSPADRMLMMTKSIRRPVARVIDWPSGTSFSRLRPSGVTSTNQDTTRAIGKPMASTAMIQGPACSGRTLRSASVPATCTTSQAVTT